MRSNNIEDIYPLSPMQQGILFHTLYAARPETYVVQIEWTLRGALDVEAWKRAWQEVFERHPALRTAFAWEKLAEPVQIVWKRLKLAMEEHDLRALAPAERAARARALADADRAKGFDPTRAPLMRFSLLRVADDAHRFVWTMHHLLLDGWSTQTVVKELWALYAGIVGAGPAPRLARVRPYGEYVRWLKKLDGKAESAFWQQQLGGFAAPTPLPHDRGAGEGEPQFGESRRFLAEPVAAALGAFARKHELTLGTVIQGAWAILLSRLSREQDVLFGSTVSGRSAPVPGVESMVGLFINTLPVRALVRPADRAVDFLAGLQKNLIDLREHEHSPLAEVQLRSDVPRGTPLFESLVVIENFPFAESAGAAPAGAERKATVAVTDGAAVERPPYPLTLSVVAQRGVLLRLAHDARRFDAAAVDRLLGHLVVLLDALVADPATAVGRLPLLAPAEIARLDGWNRAAVVAHPRDLLLHQLIEQQAARTPDAIAVAFGDASLSYRELDARAGRLALRLRALGVRPDSLVGVCLDRSLDLPVALLAVLKSGAAYLPIDPTYPRDRVDFMLEDAGAPVLIVDPRRRPELASARAEHVITADVEGVETLPLAPAETSPEHLAYVIYTSGSTGRPKGVMIPHRAIVNHMLWMARTYPLGADRALLHKTPISFDASVWEIWLPLMSGARLVVAEPDGHRDGAYLTRAVIAHGITDLQLVPSMAEILLLEPDLERASSLGRVFLGGEALSRSLVERLRARLAASVEIVNLYGPTECTVQSVVWSAEREPSGSMEPIGRPIDNVAAYVLDPQLGRLPAGVAGELFLGGACVARGYLGRPDLTAERFLPSPFAEGDRLYKTGDLCRFREDGVLEYVGRADHQVKLRGFRIELGEIESVLALQPAVREAVVVVREDTGPDGELPRDGSRSAPHAPAGDRRLVAYLVPRDLPPTAVDLRAFLAERLPEYMIPAAYVVLDAMPLSPSGKVDRRALPAPDLDGRALLATRAHVAPRTPVEQAIAGLFAEMLKLAADAVGATDSFFELGGHSLLATQVVTRARTAFGVDLPVRAIFDAPTPAELAVRVEAALAGAVSHAAPPIVPVPRSARMPLSFGQERLWFLAQLDPDSPAYVVPLALRLAGALNADALERALAEIARRHEVLRTTFVADEGRPAQVIHPPAPVPLPRTSLAALSPEERERAVRAEAEAEARRPFDLAAGPVWRAHLVELALEDHVLLLTFHHIASDLWTSNLVDRELSALYDAFSRGLPLPLPELPVQYADYAAWQRGWLSGEVLDEHLAYWKQALAGAPHVLELPTDHARPAVQSYRGAQKSFAVPPEIAAAVKELARKEGATLYMTLLAALDVLLYRWTGQDDFLVGTPLAGRTRAETEGLIGFFLNTSVLRARVAPEKSFKELLAQVRATALGAYAHQDMPFERLVQELLPEPDASRSPLFQVIFNLQNAAREGLSLQGLKIRGAVAESRTVKVDLTLIMGETPAGLVGRLEYSTDLFEAATIDRLLASFQTLLAAAAKEPQKRVRDLPVLPEAERRRLVVEWNDTAGAPPDQCFHELFEAQVDAAPSALALVAGDARLTYGELESRANRLAHHLRALGVGPDSIVGLCCDRDADLIVAILGIHKAGAAYVPLDPAHPALRLSQILADGGARVLVAHAAHAEHVLAGFASAPASVSIVRVDADAAAIAARSDARLPIDTTPANLAYVLFTSGSTGVPKGVAVEHKNLVNYIRGIGPRLALGPGATYAHVSTVSADLGNTSIFPPLATGGVIHLVPQAVATDPDAFADYVAREGIDLLKAAPSHLSALLTAKHPERVLPREIVVLGGEGLTWELCERIEALAPGCRILNHYGPTETTIGCLTYPVETGHRVAGTAIAPLGRPLPNMRVYVLDANGQPVPVGVPGEAHYSGAGIARGYLGRPDLTAERFLADPFTPGARLYKSGDRVRYLPSGDVQFLGRIDFQVKIRGFRIELGEIEGALLTHAAVREAVVLALEDGRGGRSLAAYVVSRDAASTSPADLHAWLAARVPDYMVPSSILLLDALPLTENGKIDRRALAALDREAEATDASAPRTPVEEILHAIWCHVFERERIGVHERFNDLGGHSLLAIQIVARARDALGVQVPLRAIFEAPTIASLAERLAEPGHDGDRLVAPPIQPAPRDRPLPLSFAQERLWFLHRLEEGSAFYNVCTTQRFAGQLDVAALRRALGEIVRRHEILRTTFAVQGGAPVQIVHPPADFPLPVDDLAALPEADRDAAARSALHAEAGAPFDLERGPLFRARLLRLADDDHLLSLAVHHIASDAQTQSVLAAELSALHDAFHHGRPSPLAELPIQYADYAAWQRAWLRGDVLERQLAYWRQALAGAPTSLDLPADRARPPVQTYRGARVHFHLPAELSRSLADLARREGATLFMTVLAAFDVLLRRWSGQDDIVVGVPAMNRTRAETEGLIGCFLNALVIRAQLGEGDAFTAVLRRVREACLGAYAHQDLPFERLVQEIAPARDMSRSPLFQVSFTLQTATAPAPTASSPRRAPLAAPIETAKYDLTLFATETPRGLACSFEYATDLFDRATIERLAAQLAALLASITAAPSAPLRELDLLPAAERALVTTTWNATAASFPRDATLASLVAAQAARTPDAVAVGFEGRTLTYAALDARANRLARVLRARGVGPGALVGIAVERSLGMVVGLLAIHKAGAAYVPLDPLYPRDRLAFMAEDAGLALLLTEPQLAGIVPAPPGGALHLDDPEVDAASADPLDAGSRADDRAYVIYTSGSTGKPKGVEIPIRAVVNFMASMAREPGITASDRLLAVTSLSFDIAGLEVWLPLLHGARVEIASRETAADGAALARRIAEAGITILQATPTTFRLLLDAGYRGDGALKVLVGGEAVPRELVDQLLDRVGSVWNMYGPTETTIWSCVERLTKDAPVLIGRPIANTQVYVMTSAGGPLRAADLAPIGVPGELYIGGDGLARGYLARPDLTADRFVASPFAAGERLYRTGDLVRWRAQGSLEFLGRLDFQVKIRGFRIELGEIETVLAQAEGVRRAVVMARDAAPHVAGDKRLVAYLVPADPAAPPALDALRQALRARLPDHMVPAAFVVMDAFPLTPAGKVDRRALPEPRDAGAQAAGGAVLPRDDQEARLAAIWRDVLGLAKVGVTDSFFDLGGHSMLAVRMLADVETAFGKKLPLVSLFENQTIESLARLLRRDQSPDDWPSLVPIRPGGTKRPLFLVARPNVNILGYAAVVRHLDPDIPVYGLQLRYPEESELRRPYSLEERESWAVRYLELMKGVQPEGPYFIAGMCEGALIAFDMVRRLEHAGEDVKFFGIFDTWPEENTSVRWLHRIFMRERTLRWVHARGELGTYLRSRTSRALRRLVSGIVPRLSEERAAGPVAPQENPWDARMWPGPAFVPPCVTTRIVLFRVRRSNYWRINDPEFGWGLRTSGGVDVHFIGGDHLTFMRPEHIPLLGSQLRDALLAAHEQLAAEEAVRARRLAVAREAAIATAPSS
jgi:amino acid adenylation domain-containing protein